MIFLLLAKFAIAQKEIDPVVENIIEAIASSTDNEDLDISDLTQQLYAYYHHPLNLNSASVSELESLYLLNDLQIEALKKHIEQFGPLIDFAELQTISLFDKTTLLKLKPFVRVSDPSSHGKLTLSNGENEFIIRVSQNLELSRGFKEHIYAGDRLRIYSRYTYNSSDKVSLTLLGEKDPGEQFLQGNQKYGFDFYSASLSFRNWGKLKQLIIGDYCLQFGQGLIMWTGYGIGKSALVNSMVRNGIGPKTFRSTTENGYFRGLSGNFLLTKRISLSPFVSYRNLDANVIANDSTSEITVSALQTTGFHRSATEITDKQSLKEFLYGGNLLIEPLKRLKLSLTAYHQQFDKLLEKNPELYNQFDFKGRSQTVYSIAYQLSLNRFYFFGEESKVVDGGMGFITGMMMSVTPKATLTIVHRHFDKNFHSFYSQAIGEASTNTNEQGFYSGITVNFSPKITINCFADVFKFPWLRYRVDAPSKGNEFFGMLTYSPSKKLNMDVRFMRQQKEINLSNEEVTIRPIAETIKNNYRFTSSYSLNEYIAIGNRIDLVNYSNGIAKPETGMALSVNFAIQNRSKRLGLDSRFTLFDTDSYNARIYAAEKDVLYAYSYAMYQDTGTRFYINIKAVPLKPLSFWMRYSVYSYRNKDELGSGYDVIKGSQKSEVKVQIRLTF